MEVVISDFKRHPSCPHGPCLLFERKTANSLKSGRQFFACSACRFRSECNFFQWADEAMSKERKALWERLRKENGVPYTHEQCVKRLKLFKSLPENKRNYCKTCSLLLLDESKKHSNHNVEHNVSLDDLVSPSSLIEMRENKKVEAQYIFSKSTINFLISLIKDLGFSKLILIGVPKLHEFIHQNEDTGLTSFFMDIDHRYMQFYGPEQFCHYNVFNNYFFNGKKSEKHFKDFLSEEGDQKVLLIIDPPFGGLIDAISHTLKQISNQWEKNNNKMEEIMPMMWIFPYFNEARIVKNFPCMKMMDYKVDYDNHKKFKKTKCNNSPVRIFTNIEPSHFVLPSAQGYRFCKKCERYVSQENKHCSKCNACTTKHGKTYHHCKDCQQCVKSSYIHCQECNKCDLRSAKSDQICKNCEKGVSENSEEKLEKCFKCHAVGHRKRDCPKEFSKKTKKRRLEKY